MPTYCLSQGESDQKHLQKQSRYSCVGEVGVKENTSRCVISLRHQSPWSLQQSLHPCGLPRFTTLPPETNNRTLNRSHPTSRYHTLQVSYPLTLKNVLLLFFCHWLQTPQPRVNLSIFLHRSLETQWPWQILLKEHHLLLQLVRRLTLMCPHTNSCGLPT